MIKSIKFCIKFPKSLDLINPPSIMIISGTLKTKAFAPCYTLCADCSIAAGCSVAAGCFQGNSQSAIRKFEIYLFLFVFFRNKSVVRCVACKRTTLRYKSALSALVGIPTFLGALVPCRRPLPRRAYLTDAGRLSTFQPSRCERSNATFGLPHPELFLNGIFFNETNR